ncbi:MAG: hypothetical protein J6L24_02965 [Oscillospiraceae bacterium]|nr:hypothetical protein [Oscillospiraceae bacterium]
MNFEQIYLTDAELAALRRSIHNEIPLEGNERLRTYKLVDELYSYVPGRMPVRKDRCIISDRGWDYLIFLEHQERDIRREYRHDWKIALFSALGGALISEPLWDLIRLLLRLVRGG